MSFLEFTATVSGMILLGSSIAVTIWTVLYASVFRQGNESPVSDRELPRTAVLMGLKVNIRGRCGVRSVKRR
ncbi:MAG: hypothetical protein ACKVHE_30910, partial [Planctomycetales bacterium]